MVSTVLMLIAFAEYEKAILAILAIIGSIMVWKSGLVQSLTGGQKQLIDLRTAELSQARDKNAELLARIKELEEYNRLLILNSRTTMEVAMQLKREDKEKKKESDKSDD